MRAATPMPSNAGDCPSLARQCIHVCSYRWHWLQHFIALNYQQLQHIWRHPNQPPRSRVKPWCDKLRLVSDASKARGCPAGDRTRVQPEQRDGTKRPIPLASPPPHAQDVSMQGQERTRRVGASGAGLDQKASLFFSIIGQVLQTPCNGVWPDRLCALLIINSSASIPLSLCDLGRHPPLSRFR